MALTPRLGSAQTPKTATNLRISGKARRVAINADKAWAKSAWHAALLAIQPEAKHMTVVPESWGGGEVEGALFPTVGGG